MPGSNETRPSASAEAAVDSARLEFWRSVPIFRDLPQSVCAQLSAASRRRRWPMGAILFHRDDESTYLAAVEKGRIRLSLQTSSGREFALRHVSAGTMFGEIGILDGLPRSANAMAVTATSGYTIDRRDLLALMHRHPEIAEAFIRHLCSLLRYTTEHIETIALYGLEGRLARFLLSQLPATETARADLQLELSQSDIAELLGASRPKVNRAIAMLEKEGAIRRKGKTISCNRARLIRIADPEDE